MGIREGVTSRRPRERRLEESYGRGSTRFSESLFEWRKWSEMEEYRWLSLYAARIMSVSYSSSLGVNVPSG